MMIADLAKLAVGRIFYSGRLYVVEVAGQTSKARVWGTPRGTTQGCVTLSSKSALARSYPVIERALVLPVLKHRDFLHQNRPTAYTFKTEADARRAAQLDNDLAINSGLSVQRVPRIAAWLLTDGANPHRLYHYSQSSAADAEYAAYCAKHNFVECAWPDDKTRHWTLLFDDK